MSDQGNNNENIICYYYKKKYLYKYMIQSTILIHYHCTKVFKIILLKISLSVNFVKIN